MYPYCRVPGVVDERREASPLTFVVMLNRLLGAEVPRHERYTKGVFPRELLQAREGFSLQEQSSQEKGGDHDLGENVCREGGHRTTD